MNASEPFAHPPAPLLEPVRNDSPPMLDPATPANHVDSRYALLINPFYPKEPKASFGPEFGYAAIAGLQGQIGA
jgi:hypothetical protein